MATGGEVIVRLVAEGRLVAQVPDNRALRETLDTAERDIRAADANLEAFRPWSDAMLYEAGLRAARAIVQAGGFRIDAGAGAHKTTIDAADALTDGAHHAIFVRLHRMRRRRNDFMYETAPEPTASDLTQARADVVKLIVVARQAVASIS
jgi:multidrug efflux pump subunit AcrA (membrane-fusion protein)